MPKNDDALVAPADLGLALGLLTRLPVRVAETSRGARAAWAYPLAGLVPAGLACLLGALTLSGLGWGAPLSALAVLGVLIVTTGALHEDGLADTADGLWGGWDAARRLEIMKDSRIGTYGVLALLGSFATRWAALTALLGAGPGPAIAAILSAALLSRAAMPALMAALPHARTTGLSHHVGRVPEPTAALAALVAILPCIFLLGGQVLIAGLAAVLLTTAMGWLAKTRIGGQTGDILGATQQVVEIAVLLALLP